MPTETNAGPGNGKTPQDQSLRTVLVALAVNLAVALAKFAAGLVGQSSALMSEGAHSVADSFNEVMLFTAIKRGKRPPDEGHPFGYGKERFFYSLLAAVGIFVVGAGYSAIEGVLTIVHSGSGADSGDFPLKYAVLGVSFLFEGVSLARSVVQLRDEARPRGRSVLEQWRKSIDPTVKTVALEDSAAIVGLVLALGGVAAHQVTGSSVPDGAASLAIGALLVVVAVVLIRADKDLLIGQAAQPELREAIVRFIESQPEVTAVVELLTEVLGPGELLVAARVDIDDNLSGAEVEDVSTRLEEDLRRAFPQVTQVFFDATKAQARSRSAPGSHSPP
jgi:cation diffusion facilitator family transporter